MAAVDIVIYCTLFIVRSNYGLLYNYRNPDYAIFMHSSESSCATQEAARWALNALVEDLIGLRVREGVDEQGKN